LTANNEFDGTQNVYVVVDTTDTDFVDPSTTDSTLGVIVTNFYWDDGDNDTINSIIPVTGIPVTGAYLTY
jgi:hypothetical protein